MSIAEKRIFAFITGASRGIGREIANSLARKCAQSSVFFLAARSEENLRSAKGEIENNQPSVIVKIKRIDLETSVDVDEIGEDVNEVLGTQKFDSCFIIHNAASLGNLTRQSNELNDENDWHNYLQANLISTIRLNNKIYSMFLRKKQPQIFIVDITSLLAIKAFPSFTQYSVGKAAREAYFRAFALENPESKVLSYSPGPVDTDMHKEVANRSFDETVRTMFSNQDQDESTAPELHRKKLTPAETVTKLLRILDENKFESGTRIDYFDD